MPSIHSLILPFTLLSPLALSHPQPHHPRQNSGPGLHTLTAHTPTNSLYNALKLEYSGSLNLFQSKTGSYCPGPPSVPNCPNGTDTVFSGTFYPSSMVPGGQEFYVEFDGSTRITVQHSHAFPPGSYPYYYGWTWTPVEATNGTTSSASSTCVGNSTLYDCSAHSGVFTFKAPDGGVGYEGGLRACPNKYDVNVTSVFAVTPGFNETGCVVLDGLATHSYSGVNPPVWSY